MKQINFFGPINTLGYGVVSYNLWKQISQIVDTTLWVIGSPELPVSNINVDLIQKDINKQSNFNSNIPCLKVWHENQLAERIGKGNLYALPFFEVNKFDNRRIKHLNSAEFIIVTSKWAKNIILDQTNKNNNEVLVAPCGVDREIFNEYNSQFNNNKCIFMNCGKWEIRKGHDVLHKAFKDAFQNNEQVELWMMNENPFLSSSESNEWKHLYSDNRIKLIPRVRYQSELAKKIDGIFCGVFPARSEGWNLEALEMMSCGKHIIITDYSAHTEFCNENNSYLIKINNEEPMYDGRWFIGDNGTWASLEGDAYDQLVSHLRYVYNMWQNDPYKQNKNGIETSKIFTWNKMATTICNYIEENN